MVRAALTSQLELIELNEIKEFHAELKMSPAKRNVIRTARSFWYLWAKDLRATTRHLKLKWSRILGAWANWLNFFLICFRYCSKKFNFKKCPPGHEVHRTHRNWPLATACFHFDSGRFRGRGGGGGWFAYAYTYAPDPKSIYARTFSIYCDAQTAGPPAWRNWAGPAPRTGTLHFIEIPRKIHGIKGLFFQTFYFFISFEVRPVAPSYYLPFFCLALSCSSG